MPICERDPWRIQYFEHVICPADVVVPVDDIDCWPWFPEHRWVYDRLRIAESQGMACAPHGVNPKHFPVFSKPIINLRGMGIGGRVIQSQTELDEASTAGHFWMELLDGDHISTDCAVVDGRTTWLRHATGIPAGKGMFDYWIVHAAIDAELSAYVETWITRHLPGYTGMLNIETIGGKIIEIHLRFSDQWPDLYGAGWAEALVGLYAGRGWTFRDADRHDAYSVPLFAEHGTLHRHPPPAVQNAIRSLPGVSSLQITFHESRAPDLHAMPPGGFRLGIINAFDLNSGLAARQALAAAFPNARFFREQ